MKRNIIIAIFVSMVLSFASCSNGWLEQTPYSSYSSAALKDSLSVDAALMGLHYYFGTIWTYTNAQGWLSVWQVGTDIATVGSEQGMETPYYNYGKLTNQDGAANLIWTDCYQLINNANIIINDVENQSSSISLSDAGKKRASAEAKFFRAWAYNTLQNCFGQEDGNKLGVPLVTIPLTGLKTNFTRPASADVDSLIAQDLRFSISYVPDLGALKSSAGKIEYNRVNKYMAMQLLGEAYLRMNQPAKAIPVLQSIINSGKFSLVTKRYGTYTGQAGDAFSDMFKYGNERYYQGNTEAIWVYEIENTTSIVGGYSGAPQFRRVWNCAYGNVAGMVLCDSLGGRGNGRIRLTPWVYNQLYAKNDMRGSENNLKRKMYYNDPNSANFGKQVPYQGSDTIYNICPHTTKWGSFDPNDTFGWATVKDWILMRLGETYLLLAEAQFKVGDLQGAAESINVLRKRAFPDYPLEGKVSATDITLDFILDERARELLGEENRRLILMRTKTLVERVHNRSDIVGYKPVTGISETNELLPIPLREIQLNKDATLDQNPGY